MIDIGKDTFACQILLIESDDWSLLTNISHSHAYVVVFSIIWSRNATTYSVLIIIIILAVVRLNYNSKNTTHSTYEEKQIAVVVIRTRAIKKDKNTRVMIIGVKLLAIIQWQK